jgi:hypothetical protein
MSDEVGVDVERIGQLASALENLRNVLAANVPTIVNTMNMYWSSGTGSPISLQPLQQAQSRSVNDATDIRDRATMAVAYQNQANYCLSNNMVNIPWDSSQQQLDADAAKAAAQNLAAAEAESGKNPKAARAQIQAIQALIQDNVDSHDTSWLGSFYNAASPQVANLAATLNGEDGQTMDGENPAVLTKQDQQILKTFATGLAAADKAGKLTQPAISDYAHAKNLWSVGMLFKFGPAGSAYGTQETINGQPNLVAQVTDAIEMARLKPSGYTIPLNGSNVSVGAWGATYVTQTLAQFDPAQSMLTLATQNGAAAREVLAGPDGATIAKSLMETPTTLHEPIFGSDNKLVGFVPVVPPVKGQFLRGQATDYNEPLYAMAHPSTMSPGVVGSFFTAATNAPRGTNAAAYDSAKAAMNIIDSTPPPSTAKLAAPVQNALLGVAQHYILDLADSTQNVTSTASTLQQLRGDKNLPWVIDIAHDSSKNADPLASFLQQIVSNPQDGGTLMGNAKNAFGYYYGLKATDKLPAGLAGGDPSLFMSKLMGQIQTQSNNVGIQGAQATDAQHAEYNTLLSFAESSATKIPVIGAPLGGAQTAAGLLGFNLPSFSTDNATTTYNTDQHNFAVEQLQVNVPMTQSLLNNHVITPPSTSGGQNAWYQNGKINLKNSTDVNEFNNWYSGVVQTKVNGGSLEGDVTTYQNAMGLEQSSSLTPVSGG